MEAIHIFKYAVSTNLCRFESKAAFLKKNIFLPIFCLLTSTLFAQVPGIDIPVNTDTVKNISSIEQTTLLFIDSNLNLPIEKINNRQFIPITKFALRNNIPGRLLGKKFYYRFSLQNNTHALLHYYYFPGRLFRRIQLYKINSDGNLQMLETKGLQSGFIPIVLPPDQTTTFLLELVFFTTAYNKIQSILIAPNHLQSFQNKMYRVINEKKVVGLILSGMLLMMILITLLNYFITRKIEFLYNSLYSACMFLLIFLNSYLVGYPGWFKGFFINYLDLLLLISGTILYLAFTRFFLNTKSLHPKLNKFLYQEAWVLGLIMLLYTLLCIFYNQYDYEIIIENVLKILALSAGLIYIYLSLIQKNPLMNYLAVGIAIQVFFFIISLTLDLLKVTADSIFTSAFFYFELGVICSILFFLLGLFYKSRQELTGKIREQEAMKLEAEKQSFENQLAIYKAQQEERNRISADMHDDLGAGMTAIRLYSELAKSKAGEKILPEIEKISSSSNELINKMNAIIWSMSSNNDTLANMVSYIRSYIIDYLENTGIEPLIIIPENLPAVVVNGVIRRNVFLVIKEALQNVIKHAAASEVKIVLKKEKEGMSLSIHDNGRGIDFNNIRQFSNGLSNMKKRMKDVEVEFSIENNNGTLVKLYRKIR